MADPGRRLFTMTGGAYNAYDNLTMSCTLPYKVKMSRLSKGKNRSQK